MKNIIALTILASVLAVGSATHAQVTGNGVRDVSSTGRGAVSTVNSTAQQACDKLGALVPALCQISGVTKQISGFVDANISSITDLVAGGVDAVTSGDLRGLAADLGLSDATNFVDGFKAAVEGGPAALDAFMARYLNVKLKQEASGENTSSNLEKAGIGMARFTEAGGVFTDGVNARSALEDTGRLERLAAKRQLVELLQNTDLDDSSRQLVESVASSTGSAQRLRDAAKLTTSTRAAMQVMTEGLADQMVLEATSNDQQISYLKQLVAVESYSAQELSAIREELISQRANAADEWRAATTDVAEAASEGSRIYGGLFNNVIVWMKKMRDLRPAASTTPGVPNGIAP